MKSKTKQTECQQSGPFHYEHNKPLKKKKNGKHYKVKHKIENGTKLKHTKEDSNLLQKQMENMNSLIGKP